MILRSNLLVSHASLQMHQLTHNFYISLSQPQQQQQQQIILERNVPLHARGTGGVEVSVSSVLRPPSSSPSPPTTKPPHLPSLCPLVLPETRGIFALHCRRRIPQVTSLCARLCVFCAVVRGAGGGGRCPAVVRRTVRSPDK